MFNFRGTNTEDVCAVIIEVGSASVGVSIIQSKLGDKRPTIIWTHREHALIHEQLDTADSLKHIHTALINAFLELGSTGLKALKQAGDSTITRVQATVAAPWSYTVTKTVELTDEHPIEVDEELIEGLIETSQKQAMKSMEDSGLSTQGLVHVTDSTINIRINGYNLKNAIGQKGRQIEVSHLSALVHTSIYDGIVDAAEKLAPQAELKIFSFMYTFYCTLRHLHPDVAESCLVDITSEATEVGVIRDGVLKHVTHAPYGTYTLAREIAHGCNIPKEEAYAYLKGGKGFVNTKLSLAGQDQLQAILSAYELKIATLFKATGDELSIPKTIFLHADTHTEQCFKKAITQAASDATAGEHAVHLVLSGLLTEAESADVPLLLTSQFLHDRLDCNVPRF